MIILYIDDKAADIDQETTVAITTSIGSVEDPGESSSAYTKSIKIPMTARNREIMRHTDQIYNKAQFNNENHSSYVECDGFVVIRGVVQMISVSTTADGSGYYNLNILGEEYRWVSEALKASMNKGVMSSVGMECRYIDIALSMGEDRITPMKMVPLDRGAFFEMAITADAEGKREMKPRKKLELADFVPFFHVKTMFTDIMGLYGYGISSSLTEDVMFERLYFSGKWKIDDNDNNEKTMGFKAASSADTALTLTYYRDKPFDQSDMNLMSPIGKEIFQNKQPSFKLVDTATPNDSDDSLYNNGGFTLSSEPRFAATEDCNVAFKYSLSYCSSVAFDPTAASERIHDTMMFYDTVSVGGREYKLPLPFSRDDKRDNINTGNYYLVRIEGFRQTGRYYFEFAEPLGKTHKKIPDSGEYMFSAGSDSMSVSIVEHIFSSIYRKVEKFNFRVMEVPSEAVFDLEITTEPIAVKAGQSVEIATPNFSISNPDAAAGHIGETFEFSLGVDTTVEAVFGNMPGIGSIVSAENAIDSEATQMDFIRAIRQMYNLYFYTNPITREVVMEPRDKFYTQHIVDWRDKIDLSKEITVEELGGDKCKNFKLAYASDGSVEQAGKLIGREIGTYKIPLKNAYADQGESSVVNPMFTPVLSANGFEASPAMRLLKVASPEEPMEVNGSDVNISPKIVKWVGRRSCGQVEVGNATAWYYPLMAFQDRDELVNLGFDDMGEVRGMHKHYDGNVEMYDFGRRVTVYLNLSPRNVEPLIYPNSLMQDFRAAYLLRIHGEDVYCRLESVVDYNPASAGSTKCVFVKITDKEAALLATATGDIIVNHLGRQIVVES